MKLHWQILVALGLGAKRNWHIFIALILGLVLGIFMPSDSYHHLYKIMTFVGQAFINLIQMIVIPLVVSAIIVGIASLGESRQLGKIGIKMIMYYGILTTIAVTLGAFLAMGLKPGEGVKTYINPNEAAGVQETVHGAIEAHKSHFSDIFLNMIPKNPVKSLANGEMVPIIVFVLIFGCALASIGDINRPVVSFFETIFAATMKITDWVMILASPGIFALTFSAVSKYGIGIFQNLSTYFAVLFIGFAIQLFVVYPIFMKIFCKVKPLSLYRAVADAMMVAFGTASSSATLPVTITCCERRAGISNKICSFVLPLGATMNMDGSALMQVAAVIFLTQAYGVHIDILTVAMIAVFAMIASSTGGGIPGAGIITIAFVLNGLGLTQDQLVQGFALLFAIDRGVDMFRTIVNVTSDTVVAAVIADNENEIDYEILNNHDNWKDIV